MAKVQSQLLVPERTRDRADALALAIGEPRAEVYRKALEGAGLPGLEAEYADLLAKVDAVASGMGLSRLELAARWGAAKDGLTLADLEGRKRYPRNTKA